jgi:tetratricopeptide (TPR) repeat protein
VAAQEYRAAADANPRLPGVHAALGDIHSDLGQFAEAEQAYRKELEINPEYPDNQYRMGMILAELGRSAEALPYLKKVLAREPARGEALFYLGKVYCDLDRFGEAEQTLRQALDTPLFPKQVAAAHYQLWMSYRKLNKPDLAVRHFDLFKKVEAELAEARKQGN